MRPHLLLALAVALAACTSEPCGSSETNCVVLDDVPRVDASGCNDACGAGYYCLGTRCVGEGDVGAVDATSAEPADACSVRTGAECFCAGGGVGRTAGCTTEYCDCPDAGAGGGG